MQARITEVYLLRNQSHSIPVVNVILGVHHGLRMPREEISFTALPKFLGTAETYIFRLFPIISISQKFFSFFFLKLEKIGIDEKVICYHNISN